jgi:CRP-like cAMP-binding protein
MAQPSGPSPKIEPPIPAHGTAAEIIIRPQKRAADLNYVELFAKLGKERPVTTFVDGEVLYSQGDPADSVFCIRSGRVKLSVVSSAGKEAIVSILESGCFFGEGSLIPGHPLRLATATSMGRTSVIRFEKSDMLRRLHQSDEFCDAFISYMVARAGRVEADLVDQLFNSTEKRLARVLLLFANFDKEGEHKAVIPKISQETLAQMVGASRARVSSFLNKFRKLGFIEYNDGIHVHSSLLNVILRD